jgi:hypothetical protein
VPNFVDLATGDYGPTISDALNSAQTPTMANFGTLANVLAGCATQIKADACSRVFAAAKGPTGNAPADTLAAAESIARYPWYQPERIFALLDSFYPYPESNEVVRPTPFLPYLTYAPSALVTVALGEPGTPLICWAVEGVTVNAASPRAAAMPMERDLNLLVFFILDLLSWTEIAAIDLRGSTVRQDMKRTGWPRFHPWLRRLSSPSYVSLVRKRSAQR